MRVTRPRGNTPCSPASRGASAEGSANPTGATAERVPTAEDRIDPRPAGQGWLQWIGGALGALIGGAQVERCRPIACGMPAQSITAGDFAIAWDADRAQLKISRAGAPEQILFASVPGENFVGSARGKAKIREHQGSYELRDRLIQHSGAQSLEQMGLEDDAVVLRGKLAGDRGREAPYTLRFRPGPDGLDFALHVDSPDANRAQLRLVAGTDERFFGFGDQPSTVSVQRDKLPIWVQEGGIGRGDDWISGALNLIGYSGGNRFSSYGCIPYFITDQRRGLFLKNSEYSTFDLREPGILEIEVWARDLEGRLLAGEPLEMLESFTQHAGRMPPLPDWINQGAVVGFQGDAEATLALADRLRAADAPVAAIWNQAASGKIGNFLGSRLVWNWEIDERSYPRWDALVGALEDRGIAMMTYVNPFLFDPEKHGLNAPHRNLFREALAGGYLVKRRDGQPYLQDYTGFQVGLLDLTNPEAERFIKDVIRENLIGRGVRGWMHDFGEALPADCVLHDGSDARAYHNRYPVEWARIGREAIAEAGRAGDVVFFNRSRFTESPRYSTSEWTGDQNVDWGSNDGIKSYVRSMLSRGLSGAQYVHGDIGGYTSVVVPLIGLPLKLRSPELLQRWSEAAAFTPLFRTHEGLHPDADAQIYDSPEALAHFARCARLFRALAPYRAELMREASAHGYPLVRHPFLHYPDDREAQTLDRQFMLGPDLMIAPVLDPGVDRVHVYLPPGEWVHVHSGRDHDTRAGGRWCEVAAPIGQPAVFARRGSPAACLLREHLRTEAAREVKSHPLLDV